MFSPGLDTLKDLGSLPNETVEAASACSQTYRKDSVSNAQVAIVVVIVRSVRSLITFIPST